MATQFASSSSSYTSKLRYDVFLSFKGKDTRNNFISHLYKALHQKGINIFIDDEELQRGEEISPALLEAIKDSRISLAIFSENYAASSWCLDELVQIIECKETKGQMVYPIFYHVNPSEFRHQIGCVVEAFAKHKDVKRHNKERIQTWRTVLNKVAELSGWHLRDGSEASFIERIVKDVCSKLNHVYLNVANQPIGLEPRVQEVKCMLDYGVSNVNIVGIHGIGGIGKTTIAKALYNMIANQFEGCSFLPNVRECSKECEGLVKLQEVLLSEILQSKEIKIHNSSRGINLIKERLCNKRVLLVLDDVDDLEQLKSLARERNWFGLGSRIIVTTRDEHLLVEYGVDKDSIYRVKELDNSDSLQLLCWNAFKEHYPRKGFEELSNYLVRYTQGLPLALVVLGSFLFGRSKEKWKSTLSRLKKIPDQKIFNVLKISFDGLEVSDKDIFLDIACFFNGEEIHKITKVLDACNFDPEIGIDVLVERNLLTIDHFERLMMHDLIRDMGREIVRQESNDPGKRSRLWFHEDILQVLQDNSGTYRVQGMKLTPCEPEEVQLTHKSFKKMERLRLLIIHNAQFSGDLEYLPNELRWLEWPGYPFSSLPINFSPKKLVVFDMPRSRLKLLCHPVSWSKDFISLKYMNLKDCEFITKVPDLLGCCNLEDLNLAGCSRLKEFPELIDNMDRLRKIQLSRTGIKELPSSIECITGLRCLYMSDCKNLTSISSCIYKLQKLMRLRLDGCSKLGKFPVFSNKKQKFTSLNEGSDSIGSTSSLKLFPSLEILDLENCSLSEVNFLTDTEHFPALSRLYLAENNITAIPACLHKLAKLSFLNVYKCKLLQEIPELPANMEQIVAIGCESLQRLQRIDFSACHRPNSTLGDQSTNTLLSRDFKLLKSRNPKACECQTEVPDVCTCCNLEHLIREGCTSLTDVHESTDNLERLHVLNHCNCSNLVSLPISFKLNSLTHLYLDGCSRLKKLSEIIDKITGLQYLDISHCQNLTNLPSSIYKLQNLRALRLGNCTKLGKFPSLDGRSSSTGSASSLNIFPSLETLVLTNCNLSEVNFLTDTEHFPALSRLYLNENNITTIPARLHKLAKLSYLNVSECKLLQEIPELPANMESIDASGCESLQRYSELELEWIIFSNCYRLSSTHGDQWTSILQPEGFVNKREVRILIPGNVIPEWFSHKGLKSPISLQVPINTSINIVVALALGAILVSTLLGVWVFINGKCEYSLSRRFDSMHSDHLWLCYIPQIFPRSSKGDYVDVEVKVFERCLNEEYSLEYIDLLESKDLGVHLMEG